MSSDAMLRRVSKVELLFEKDVGLAQGGVYSTSKEPWLRFESLEAFEGARFVELTYRTSLYDDPVRPVLRFITRRGAVERILPGPVAGAGIWRGAVPRGTQAVLISPSARIGRFGFLIESVRPLALAEMLALVWRRKRKKLWSILLASVFGYFAEAENAMDWAIGSEPLEDFPQWRLRRERPIDMTSIDAPRSDWKTGPRFLILIPSHAEENERAAKTLLSLKAQAYPHFQAAILTREPKERAFAGLNEDSRISVVGERGDCRALFAQADFIALLRPGDALLPHALAVIAEEAARNPAARLFYADELIGAHEQIQPLLKPDWDPLSESERPYLGRCVFLSASSFTSAPPFPEERSLRNLMRETALRLARENVVHLRRWLLLREKDGDAQRVEIDAPRLRTPLRDPPLVSIILPTRDRADLLGPCLESVLSRSTYRRFELLIIDNGSGRADAKKLLADAEKDPRVRVIPRPGPFNFARVNNEAARSSRGDVLLFLNNDTEILTEDWLERFSEHALAPGAGAVGALLLFPDGRVQHAGVVVGLGEDVGHFEALADLAAPSWLDRVRSLRETSAVTAACMAVARSKFEAVGGFDAVNLPIEFNDIDLCLRLAERGWRSRYEPAIRIIHKESATRGNALLRPLGVYARERRYFRERWGAIIRDDPYFHPCLSLYSRQAALG